MDTLHKRVAGIDVHRMKHVVTVLPRGYAWRGQRFLTLPQVARAITESPMDVRALFGRRDG